MLTLTSVLCKLVEAGYPVRIDLVNKTIEGKRFRPIYENGKVVASLIHFKDYEYDNLKDLKLIDDNYNIEDLYHQFKYSLPTTREKKSYFYALPPDKMTNQEMIDGIDRDVARVMLECYVLFNSDKLKELFPNDKAYYWKSEKDKDLVLLREWL